MVVYSSRDKKMGKKHHAELRGVTYYCSKCDKELPLDMNTAEFDGWQSNDGDLYHHGGSSVAFICIGCKNWYSITLNDY
jgi:hypothetical protein